MLYIEGNRKSKIRLGFTLAILLLDEALGETPYPYYWLHR